MNTDELDKITEEELTDVEELEPEPEPPVSHHQHVYIFQLNANHTLIRGCMHCGQAHATLVMGDPEDLQWHRVKEPSEE